MVAFDNVVDQEDLRVAKSWGGDTELARAQSFQENCAALLSGSYWGRAFDYFRQYSDLVIDNRCMSSFST